MPLKANNTEAVYHHGVELGFLEIRDDGTVWRLAQLHYNGSGAACPVEPRRAESTVNRYLNIQLRIDGKQYTTGAHRLVWRHFNGPIPGGLVINHKDGVRTNNTPSNLEALTNRGNARHAVDVLGVQLGENNSSAKLTWEQVKKIREWVARGETQRSVAAIYEVSQGHISDIVTRKKWKGFE